MTSTPDVRLTIVMPAYREGRAIEPILARIAEAVTLPFEALIVVDTADDPTVEVVEELARTNPQFRVLVNEYGRGPGYAIRYGIDHAAAAAIVVTMADGSDDPRQIDDLVRLVERGVVVACASRYMSAGQQVGGPAFKSFLSKAAGRSLHLFARVGTCDATNSFKAYSTEFVRMVGIESRAGFAMGIELTAKARRLRLPVAEIPTIWLEREHGVSNFKVASWIPGYLHWYFFAFGRRLTPAELAEKIAADNEKRNRAA
jgi:dolichol-phosphate mannosyltransferase